MAGSPLGLCLQLFGILVFTCFFIEGVTALYSANGHDKGKVCYGTSMGMATRGSAEFRYKEYRKRYSNCTYLVGNLEIVNLDEYGERYDLGFLSSIREVTGYVLLASNAVDYIPLTSLQIIRGMTLYQHPNTNANYSLFVVVNFQRDRESTFNPETSMGLKELRFTSLSEILNGMVYFQNNNYLCYENTINWKDINPTSTPPVIIKDSSKLPKRKCGECHESCYNPVTGQRHCWGEGPHMCQKLSHGEVCHPNCGRSRCNGSLPDECCHPECAGGCSGPGERDCFACRNFEDDASCVPYCPKAKIYDRILLRPVRNPKMKYAFGSVCVKECPPHMLQDGSYCVRTCEKGKHAKDSRNCEPCNGPCPRRCEGVSDSEPNYLHSKNIHSFEGCTTLEGDLLILAQSFKKDPHYNIEPLHPSNLTVLRHIKEITGYLLIQSNHSDFTDLSFLSSLETIHGRTTHGTDASSLNLVSTPLKSLELTSLKSIRNGNVVMLNNRRLCYISTIDWKQLFSHNGQFASLNFNRPQKDCETSGDVCHPQCGTSGCWGKGADRCLSCANYVYEKKQLCLELCTDMERLYHRGEGKCEECHPECANTCNGPNNTDCDRCAHVRMRNSENVDSCLPECGSSMYPDKNQLCKPCHPFCGRNSCTGPLATVGENGCNKCDIGIRENNSVITCMEPQSNCQPGYYLSLHSPLGPSGTAFRLCVKCSPLCITCTASGTQFCECRYYRLEGNCVRECPTSLYADPVSKECLVCDKQCRGGCDGPTSFNCKACSNFKIYYNPDNTTEFNCTAECPANLPYTVKDMDSDENRIVCADSSHPDVIAMASRDAAAEKKKLSIIVGAAVTGTVIMGLLICAIVFGCFKRAQTKMKAAEYTAKITGYEEIEPLTPTNAKPDLAQMRIINESELRRGAIIGSGAFGTVYKGIWIPQGENVKIPVAIKVLQEGTSPGQSTELLEEARVMCSVEHMCCVRILAVCMSSQMMLVTQLMPHGCLLEYVRENKPHIGSKVLLNWCTQISRGMAYLEERGIVHRDLAARNVLVQTPNQVKITDFGLAKLLDFDSEEYHAQGGLMPIKWLALECIQHRIFTHKSDVWSFGVTVWELFTYGKKPYDGIRTRDVPMMLEKGERLQQPMMCTIDVYMIMVKCWMLESDSRPSFKELAEEFAKMSRDPGRYLVIEGDTLMRLPSVTYDKDELVKGMSDSQGPENVMDAEEYLQPAEEARLGRQGHRSPHLVFERQHSNSPSSPLGRIAEDPDGVTFAGKPMWEGQKVREKKYAHLNAAARAKQERQLPRSRGDSVNSRYSSDPIKFSKDRGEVEWLGDHGSVFEEPMSPQGGHSDLLPPPVKTPTIHLPVDEDNYLQPKSTSSAAAYTDLNDKGYYQNEKAFGSTATTTTPPHKRDPVDTMDIFNYASSPPVSPSAHSNSPKYLPPAVANPGYYEGSTFVPTNDDDDDDDDEGADDDEEGEVWETKKPMKNGYHPVPNAVASPVKSGVTDSNYSYYNDCNGGVDSSPKVNTKVTLSGRHNSESMV